MLDLASDLSLNSTILFQAIGLSVRELGGVRYLWEVGSDVVELPPSWGPDPCEAARAYRAAHPAPRPAGGAVAATWGSSPPLTHNSTRWELREARRLALEQAAAMQPPLPF